MVVQRWNHFAIHSTSVTMTLDQLDNFKNYSNPWSSKAKTAPGATLNSSTRGPKQQQLVTAAEGAIATSRRIPSSKGPTTLTSSTTVDGALLRAVVLLKMDGN